MLKNSRKLKGTRVYINEHLTHKNSQIAYAARILKKQGKIYSTWTKDCRVFIKTNGNPDVAKVNCIKNETDFDMLHICYELFGRIVLKNHTFSFFFHIRVTYRLSS